MLKSILSCQSARNCVRFLSKETAFKASKPDNYINLDGQLYVVRKMVHGKRGMHGAFVRVTLKNLATQSTVERTFNSDEMLEVVDLSKETASYSWEDTVTNELVFMNPKTFDEIRVPKGNVERPEFLYEGMEVAINKNGEQILGVQLPTSADYTIVSINQANMSGSSYWATLNSGAKVQVPINVKEGLRVKIKTDDGTFIGRA